MKKVLVSEVLQRMLKALDNEQLKLLEKTLNECLVAVDVVSAKEQEQQEVDYISLFVSAKRIEGRSEKTLTYYKNTIDKMIEGILDTDLIDMLMFSVNPAYDYNHGDYAYGGVDERADVYKRCEKQGVGISVMKPFSGGQLLSDKTSPFGKALTPYQCIKYALDKPGILTVLPGAQSVTEIDALLKYYEQTEEELDYSIIGSFAPPEASGKCVYCNHCEPCPAGIDIGAVNKFYDLASIGDDMAKEHYRALEKNAADCISCGHCNSRCPFSVDQMSRMQEIKEYYGQHLA